MSNLSGDHPWVCARCGTRNLVTAKICARCGRPYGGAVGPADAGRPARPAARTNAPRARAEGSPGFAAVLSAVLPGLGQIYAERWVRGILLFVLPLLAIALGGAFIAYADALTSLVLRFAPLVTFLVVGGLLAYHLFVVGDAFAGRMHSLRGRHAIDYLVLALVTLGLIAGYTTVYRQSAPWAAVAARMFAPFSQRAATTGGPADAPPEWSGSERLNVLLLGIDTRDGDPATANTDTMLVLSLDPLSDTAVMLSIPRDTFINIRGSYTGKINGAYAAGGPTLARKAVDDLLGIRLNAYALIDFTAFYKIIDGVGGVIVDVKRPVRDEAYPTADYGVERIDILPGPQLMHGDSALKYARSRHDSNDYSRARRQQEIIGALRTKLARPEALRSLPGLLENVGTTIATDFDPANVLPLARTGTSIPSSDIRSEVLYPCGADLPHCELTVTQENGFYLIPDKAKVLDLVAQLFYDPKVRREAARVEVQNAGARGTTAKDVADRLAQRSFVVSGPADGAAAKSAIVLRNSGKRYTAEQLKAQLDLPIETADGPGADIVVRVGSDFRGFVSDRAR